MKTNIAKLLGPELLQFEEQMLEAQVAEHQVLAKTIVTVISPGTEIAAYLGHPPLRPGNIYPRVVGYCNVAEIVSVGSQVEEYQPGDKVLSFQSHRSAFIVDSSGLIAKLPDSEKLTDLATTYLFHLGYHALLDVNFEAKDRVAVVGLGTLGLTTTAVARHLGADVTAFSNQSIQRAAAVDFGATSAHKKMLVEELKHSCDIIVLTTNTWSDWQLALELADVGARIAVLGFPGRTEGHPEFNPLASQYLYDKQLTIKGVGNPPSGNEQKHYCRHSLKHNMAYLIKAIHEGKLPASKLISERFSSDRLVEAYQLIATKEPGIITAAIDWTKNESV